MYVLKRNGTREDLCLDKITSRIRKLCYGLNAEWIDPVKITLKVVSGIYSGITTTELDLLTAETCAYSSTYHPDWSKLGARILCSNLHKNTDSVFSRNIKKMYEYKHPKTGENASLISKELYEVVMEHADKLDNAIYYDRDYDFDYFGFKTLERSYLLKMHDKPVERPAQLFMRVACAIHTKKGKDKAELDLDAAIETYNLMSQRFFTHATPTLYNAGTPHSQLSSCFLMTTEDSIDGIYKTLKDCANISKYAGGIGISIHDIRAARSYIKGTNGTSNGIVPMLKVFSDTARYVDQCLDPNTIVYTKSGPKKIKNVMMNDKVITDDGNFYRIRRVLDYDFSGNMHMLNVMHTLHPLKLTEMHPLYVVKNRSVDEPEFIEVMNIKEGDYVGFPIPAYSKDMNHISLDDCRFYGIFNSCIKKLDNFYSIQLKRDTDTVIFVKDYLVNNFIEFFTGVEGGETITINWRKNRMFKFTKDMVYDEDNRKFIVPFLMHLPNDKITMILKGLLENNITIHKNYAHMKNSYSDITESIRYMFLRLGVIISGNSSVIEIPLLPQVVKMLNLDITPADSLFDSFFIRNGCIFTKVVENSIVKNYTGRVMDIEVDNEQHHNFLTHSGLVKNGGGKRKGSFAIYLEPWHADIFDFLELKKNNGKEEMRARDLFYALWISDLFMERVENNGDWTLFCPNEAPGLSDVYGDEFKKLYTQYETEGRGRQTVKAQQLWFAILQSQIESGTPYMLYKDACNEKSNQKNLGVIKSSNLCTEIVEYTSKDEIAVCNLASIALNAYVKNDDKKSFDYNKLAEVSRIITRNLNKIIDINYYPVPEARNSNLRHRPIGIGVQGLADTFALMEYPFESLEAAQLNKNIFETIYYASLTASCELAEKEGPYSSFYGVGENPIPCPASNGVLQFDLWNVKPNQDSILGPVYDWDSLKQRIRKHGLRNSLLLAPMPTASTAQILGNNESIEPFTSNIYSRRVLSGEFPVINRHLLKSLIELGLWNENVRMQIIAEKGSIQNIECIPRKLKELYKTVWEIKMKSVIDMAADRGAFICQSQSMNLFVAEPTVSKLSSMHFYSWKRGLKTGIYYLRTQPKADAIQFTVDQNMIKSLSGEKTTNKPDNFMDSNTDKVKMRAEEAARKRQEIREAMKRGEYNHEDEICISCGS